MRHGSLFQLLQAERGDEKDSHLSARHRSVRTEHAISATGCDAAPCRFFDEGRSRVAQGNIAEPLRGRYRRAVYATRAQQPDNHLLACQSLSRTKVIARASFSDVASRDVLDEFTKAMIRRHISIALRDGRRQGRWIEHHCQENGCLLTRDAVSRAVIAVAASARNPASIDVADETMRAVEVCCGRISDIPEIA